MTEWQSIETAPKDKKFLCKYGGKESACFWDNERKVFVLEVPLTYVQNDKPKWKLLPDPPK